MKKSFKSFEEFISTTKNTEAELNLNASMNIIRGKVFKAKEMNDLKALEKLRSDLLFIKADLIPNEGASTIIPVKTRITGINALLEAIDSFTVSEIQEEVQEEDIFTHEGADFFAYLLKKNPREASKLTEWYSAVFWYFKHNKLIPENVKGVTYQRFIRNSGLHQSYSKVTTTCKHKSDLKESDPRIHALQGFYRLFREGKSQSIKK